MAVRSLLGRGVDDSTAAGDYDVGFNGPARGLATLSIIGPLLALLFTCNRIYWRVKVLGCIWYDDWAILLAMVAFPRLEQYALLTWLTGIPYRSICRCTSCQHLRLRCLSRTPLPSEQPERSLRKSSQPI
jgi:hypothetical protein